jgi:hypothetical protein
MDMIFGTLNVKSLHRAGSILKLSKKLSKCKLDLVGVKEVRWEVVVTNKQENIYSYPDMTMRIID